MFQNYSPIVQALFGTLFTWALTAAGALVVVFFQGTQPRLLDCSLGFAAGVMTAASYWSLLTPAIDMAKESRLYGANGEYAFIPACLGFFLGALFTFAADVMISRMGIKSPSVLIAHYQRNGYGKLKNDMDSEREAHMTESIVTIGSLHSQEYNEKLVQRRVRHGPTQSRHPRPPLPEDPDSPHQQWRRILLLIIAITVHNIPEGLAVGVGFGAVGSSPSASFATARNLAIGIGIQNFPEGLAVSLPLKASGFSTLSSIWYGQLSGMVEPVFGLLGALLVTAALPILPYALAFAAGAMIYVVVDDIIPEANTKGNGRLATWGAISGFLVMMLLEVALE